MDFYSKICLQLELKRELLFNEIEVLHKLRDTLLPKLISGELRIKDAEKLIEESGI